MNVGRPDVTTVDGEEAGTGDAVAPPSAWISVAFNFLSNSNGCLFFTCLRRLDVPLFTIFKIFKQILHSAPTGFL